MVITIFPTFAYQKKTDLLVGGGVCTEITSRSITLSALTICVSAANCGHKVNESASLRRQSKQLLEYAKQAVEMAIEQGEDAALVWLKERSGE